MRVTGRIGEWQKASRQARAEARRRMHFAEISTERGRQELSFLGETAWSLSEFLE